MSPAHKGRRHERKYLRSLISAFLSQLAPALDGDSEAIHQLRVGGRRLRVILPLLARDPAARRVRRTRCLLHGLTRAAAGGRDHDVRLALLEKIPTRDTALVRVLRQRLRAARRRAHRSLLEELRDADDAQLRRLLRAALEDIVESNETLARIAALQHTEHESLRGGLAKLGRRFDVAALHAERRRLRRLRYVAELQDHLLRQEPVTQSVLRQMQTQLGDIHDQWLLAQWLQVQVTARRSPRRRAQAILRLRNQVLRMARARHRAWLAGNPVQRLESAFQLSDTRSTP